MATRHFHLPGESSKSPAALRCSTHPAKALIHVYARDLQEAQHANALTFDEARHIAVNVARLPVLLAKGM
jgi:hypothetical protein